jgi:hypothetical protein
VVYNGVNQVGGWLGVEPTGFSSGAPVFPHLCQRHDESKWGTWFVLFCPQMTQTFLQKGGDPVELFEKVKRGLGKLGRWFKCKRLTLNLKNTEYVYFSRTRPPEVPLVGLAIEGSRSGGRRVQDLWASGSMLG